MEAPVSAPDDEFDPEIWKMLQTQTDEEIFAKSRAIHHPVIATPLPARKPVFQRPIEIPGARGVLVLPSKRYGENGHHHHPDHPNKRQCAVDQLRKLGVDEGATALQKQEMDEALDENQQNVILAAESGVNVFIAGQAGVGKSRVLKALYTRLIGKGKIVHRVAHNGVAAANISGTTIHSYAGIGTGPPPYKCHNKDAQDRIKWTDVLIIDEISTVSNHMLTGLDLLFRVIRENMERPFGGIQIITCGDFAQLKPINDKKRYNAVQAIIHGKQEAKEMKKSIRETYKKYHEILTDPKAKIDFCFESKAWPLVITRVFVLDKIYRQSDPAYLDALADVRMANLTEKTRQLLISRLMCNNPEKVLPGMQLPDDYVMLYSKRKEVESYNTRKLQQLTGDDGYDYKAVDVVNVETLRCALQHFPVPEAIHLKVGARVMLKKNLPSSKMVNGSCGVVVGYAEIFAQESVTGGGFYRPVEGCILPKAIPREKWMKLPYCSKQPYSLPDGMQSAVLPAHINLAKVCPRSVFPPPIGPPPGDAQRDLESTSFFLPTAESQLVSLRNTQFYPLPVVAFDNGEIMVMMPQEWKIEEQQRVEKKKDMVPQKQQQQQTQHKKSMFVKLVSRHQIPLIHAWSLSVHMAQGLTIKKLCVDLGRDIFDEGQSYVALSRGESLEGLLIRDLDFTTFTASERVKQFCSAIKKLAERQHSRE